MRWPIISARSTLAVAPFLQGGSSLTDSRLAVPDADLDNKSIPNYVPFRNAHFPGLRRPGQRCWEPRIFIGAVFEDSSGYPDCRPEYYDAMNALIHAGTRPEATSPSKRR
jgi:7-cyano-7-deazaguanine synthase